MPSGEKRLNKKDPQKEISALTKQLRLFQLAIIMLFMVIGIGTFLYIWDKIAWKQPQDAQPPQPPALAQIKQIISPLGYSGLQNLLKDDVMITVDFDRKTWTIHNLHRFNDKGHIKLFDGKYGLCGDLAAHVFDKIQPLLGTRFNFFFLHVAESGFFLDPRASHIALLLQDKTPPFDEYIIDPSFGKYGHMDTFEDYQFFEKTPILPFLAAKKTDETFAAGISIPLFIKKDCLISMVIDFMNGRFDRNNFIIAITATKRYKYAGRYLLAYRVVDGATHTLENKLLTDLLLGKNTYNLLKNKLTSIIRSLQPDLAIP